MVFVRILRWTLVALAVTLLGNGATPPAAGRASDMPCPAAHAHHHHADAAAVEHADTSHDPSRDRANHDAMPCCSATAGAALIVAAIEGDAPLRHGLRVTLRFRNASRHGIERAPELLPPRHPV